MTEFRRSLIGFWTVMAIWALTGAMFPAGAAPSRTVLLLCDVSGSMQEKISYTASDGESERAAKILIMHQLLSRLADQFTDTACDLGIFRFRHRSGDQAAYETLLPVGRYLPEHLRSAIKDEFETDFPVFNRRTPLAAALRELDDRELKRIDGHKVMLLVSDGQESFNDADQDDRSPLAELRRLKYRHEAALTVHTVYIGQADDVRAQKRLKDLAAVGEGEYYPINSLAVAELLAELKTRLCPAKPAEEGFAVSETAAAPEPPLAAAPVPPAQPADDDQDGVINELDDCPDTPAGVAVNERGCPTDSDGDGVPDQSDKCPGTPVGAKVNAYGCWVLTSVQFDYNQARIKPEFHAELQSVAAVLTQNPDLRVEIQGHTDNIGSMHYNQKLSENRAKAVMDYLVQQGIPADRLTYKGYGYAQPVVPNTSDENRAVNRRVELQPLR